MKIALEIARQAEIDRLTSVKEASSENINEKAKRFLEVFATTSILVAAQYFQNPYSEDESGCLKRSLSPWSLEDSEEEESFEPTPSKKRKFSFWVHDSLHLFYLPAILSLSTPMNIFSSEISFSNMIGHLLVQNFIILLITIDKLWMEGDSE